MAGAHGCESPNKFSTRRIVAGNSLVFVFRVGGEPLSSLVFPMYPPPFTPGKVKSPRDPYP